MGIPFKVCYFKPESGLNQTAEAIEAYLKGNLDYNPEVHCTTHEHGHSCGEHHCGEEKHGCSGNGENQ